ncbi:hypothetical protein ALMP_11420 [Streptomyces sp. A012304]|nr:hypothetical protein ALMP_11420 [Streptomyces sp. A012304]
MPELGDREIHPDQVVEVPDERFEGYVCQTSTWEPIEEPGAAKKKTAAKPPQKMED